ncbi:CHL1 helicase [Coprinopsis cinerea okayama7|uniref:ATP-dependent DNA helicase CHL1 n=1 Tax=Coprinopsis cinerea (strain Okayama-7 / 130 / ATCC MYA-4618 / FGSC 9003) TaxID=240176 RepID=A8NRY2_COPC7|nr:CHL1 helicase [Coprinopsis cinerea okayama7\|eukprot:XP_001835886.2 CHL1 helicase [Coprinopsis cinerea okayama7\
MSGASPQGVLPCLTTTPTYQIGHVGRVFHLKRDRDNQRPTRATGRDMDLELATPSDFPAFPYDPPYAIQVDLMRHVYEAIEKKHVTIVESPTGTGKTLTLLCSSLTWLLDEKDRARKGKLKEVAGVDGEEEVKDWVIEQTLARVRREMEADEREYEEKLARARKREEQLRRMAKARVTKKMRYGAESSNPKVDDDEDEDQFLPENDQDDEDSDYVSPALRALMQKLDRVQRTGQLGDEEETTCTKIYYASRTHSQLSQVLPELRRLKLKQQISVANHCTSAASGNQASTGRKRCAEEHEDTDEEVAGKRIRIVALGSRKQLCINDELREKSSDLDEACRELLGGRASQKDIEDLAEAGRLANTCPYFGSRKAIPQAELVTLPYNLLLQKSAREALGIDLKGQIVIIDEAHNLIPTLLSLSTHRLSYGTLAISLQQVAEYVRRFKTRLSPANMLQLKRLVIFLEALKKAAGINLLEVEAYLKKSKIARKISGYVDKQAEKDSASSVPRRKSRKGAIPPLHVVEDFMKSLSNVNDDGRVTFTLVETAGQEATVELKYQLLNPAPNFLEIVEDARAIILAGGTMSPISDVTNQLFYSVPRERVSNFSCGHVIPEDNLKPLAVMKGPKGHDLDFRANRQSDPTVLAELGQIIFNYASITPAGMIVFFPSYSFLNTAKATWGKSKVLDRFGTKKAVFFEPEESNAVESVLQEYSKAAQVCILIAHQRLQYKPAGLFYREQSVPSSDRKGGGLLFAVIGAKLSEGLNFSDDLARTVIIVGLPFANLGSPELRERMKYVKMLEEKRQQNGDFSKPAGQKDAAAELYENICMNAVNQSIGRAIRHRNDWASLLLLDRRYASATIRNKLPKWIGNRLVVTDTFGQSIKELASFFSKRIEPVYRDTSLASTPAPT